MISGFPTNTRQTTVSIELNIYWHIYCSIRLYAFELNLLNFVKGDYYE